MANDTQNRTTASPFAGIFLAVISLVVIVSAFFLPDGAIKITVVIVGVLLVGATLAVVLVRPRSRKR